MFAPLRITLALSLIIVAQGCASFCDCIDGHLTCMHDKRDSRRAWIAAKDCYYEQVHLRDFRRGFLDGYFNAIQGGGECLPTLPPRRYWSVHNRGDDSQARIVAWFNGYSQGSLQAASDGAVGRGRILTSAHIYNTLNCPTCPPEHTFVPEPAAVLPLDIEPLPKVPGLDPPGDVPQLEPAPIAPPTYMPPPEAAPLIIAPPAAPAAAELDKPDLFTMAAPRLPAFSPLPAPRPESVPVRNVSATGYPTLLVSLEDSAPAALIDVKPAINPRQPPAVIDVAQPAAADPESEEFFPLPEEKFLPPVTPVSHEVAEEPASISLPPRVQPAAWPPVGE